MDTVQSPDLKLEMNDVQKLLSREAPFSDYPPPYGDNPGYIQPSVPNMAACTSNGMTSAMPAGQSMIIQQASQSAQPIILQPQSQMMGKYNVGRARMNVYCQNCQSGVKSVIDTTHKCSTHCCCLLLALTGILGPFCCVPYCFCSPDKVEHTCPNCKNHIGTYYG